MSRERSSSAGRRWRRAARALAVVGVALAIAAVRVLFASRAELERGRELEARADLDAAIPHYRRAAKWYAPGSPYVAEALDRLAGIGRRAEAAGERERALAAWGAVHAAIASARGVWVPHRARLEEADAHLGRLRAADGAADGPSAAERGAELGALPGPSPFWTLLLLAGFAAWVGGAFAFARRAIDAEDRLASGPARRWGVLVVCGFVAFTLGLAFA